MKPFLNLRFKAIRKSLNFSQTQMKDNLLVEQAKISNIETGKDKSFLFRSLNAMVEMGINLNWLVSEHGSPMLPKSVEKDGETTMIEDIFLNQKILYTYEGFKLKNNSKNEEAPLINSNPQPTIFPMQKTG